MKKRRKARTRKAKPAKKRKPKRAPTFRRPKKRKKKLKFPKEPKVEMEFSFHVRRGETAAQAMNRARGKLKAVIKAAKVPVRAELETVFTYRQDFLWRSQDGRWRDMKGRLKKAPTGSRLAMLKEKNLTRKRKHRPRRHRRDVERVTTLKASKHLRGLKKDMREALDRRGSLPKIDSPRGRKSRWAPAVTIKVKLWKV